MNQLLKQEAFDKSVVELVVPRILLLLGYGQMCRFSSEQNNVFDQSPECEFLAGHSQRSTRERFNQQSRKRVISWRRLRPSRKTGGSGSVN